MTVTEDTGLQERDALIDEAEEASKRLAALEMIIDRDGVLQASILDIRALVAGWEALKTLFVRQNARLGKAESALLAQRSETRAETEREFKHLVMNECGKEERMPNPSVARLMDRIQALTIRSGSYRPSPTAESAPGYDWELSDETRAAIEEIENHLRSSAALAHTILVGRPSPTGEEK